MWPNPQETADFVTFNEEILNEEENTTLNYYDLRDHETVWEENRSIVHWHFCNVRQEKTWLVQDNGLLLDK